jgi:hypothetical protein
MDDALAALLTATFGPDWAQRVHVVSEADHLADVFARFSREYGADPIAAYVSGTLDRLVPSAPERAYWEQWIRCALQRASSSASRNQ